MYKVFIDGSAGTTGLKIFDRLKAREDISLITLPDELRKNLSAREEAINSSDVTFLCLPDDAARESVSLIKNDKTIVIDTSTAHRVNDDFTYGFAEIKNLREKLKSAKKIANPGCHASGFISLISPLVDAGVIKNTAKLTAYSLTGYTGGGKKMIAEYEGNNRPISFDSPRLYGLSQSHKHLPEMVKFTGLETAPVFMPIVCDYACGMQVTVPLFSSDISCKIDDIKQIYKSVYNGKVVKYSDDSEGGFLASNTLSNRDDMLVSVFGNEDRITLVSRFDNLGKGASGAAVQNMNIALGLDETTGLNLGE
ncbi:MAG: N-acetyl-gamma-glutamyl-phosphate reductase [Clostridia bacterium]|nr:N-acetyl-gamma-glutamyl-phosphate reductase [Clostridia bacterium]